MIITGSAKYKILYVSTVTVWDTVNRVKSFRLPFEMFILCCVYYPCHRFISFICKIISLNHCCELFNLTQAYVFFLII